MTAIPSNLTGCLYVCILDQTCQTAAQTAKLNLGSKPTLISGLRSLGQPWTASPDLSCRPTVIRLRVLPTIHSPLPAGLTNEPGKSHIHTAGTTARHRLLAGLLHRSASTRQTNSPSRRWRQIPERGVANTADSRSSCVKERRRYIHRDQEKRAEDKIGQSSQTSYSQLDQSRFSLPLSPITPSINRKS